MNPWIEIYVYLSMPLLWGLFIDFLFRGAGLLGDARAQRRARRKGEEEWVHDWII